MAFTRCPQRGHRDVGAVTQRAHTVQVPANWRTSSCLAPTVLWCVCLGRQLLIRKPVNQGNAGRPESPFICSFTD